MLRVANATAGLPLEGDALLRSLQQCPSLLTTFPEASSANRLAHQNPEDPLKMGICREPPKVNVCDFKGPDFPGAWTVWTGQLHAAARAVGVPDRPVGTGLEDSRQRCSQFGRAVLC